MAFVRRIPLCSGPHLLVSPSCSGLASLTVKVPGALVSVLAFAMLMAPHSSTLAWKVPWVEEPGKLQSMGSLGVGHNWATSFTFHFHALEKEMATHLCSCLKNPKDGGAWWAAVYGVTQSWTRLKQCSSSSRSGKECRVQMTESQSKSSVGIINEDAG